MRQPRAGGRDSEGGGPGGGRGRGLIAGGELGRGRHGTRDLHQAVRASLKEMNY